MKKLIPAFVILAMIACNPSAKEHSHGDSAGTHTHEDGSTHADHDTAAPAQETFTPADTLQKLDTVKTHTHGDGKTHSH